MPWNSKRRSFAFGFGGDDIEDGSDLEQEAVFVSEMPKHTISDPQKAETHGIEPKRHILAELVSV